MKHASSLRALCAVVCALIGLSVAANAQFTISTGVGPFAPSFRGSANTTWFGWGSGSFDGPVDNELIDNPLATLGTTSTGYSLNQLGTDDILSSSNNIYTSSFAFERLVLTIPIAAGTDVFTTIILQGNTAFGGFNEIPVFSAIAGVTPTVVAGSNAAGGAQFWAKYQIPSSANSQTVNIDLGAFTSIANITVDTLKSTSYASDTAQAVPEPGTAALLGGVGLFYLLRRRPRARIA